VPDGQEFAIPGDCLDHVEYGWPFGFWRVFHSKQWDTIENQLDVRGLAADGILWGYLAVAALIPAAFQLIRNRKDREAANNTPEDIRR
jgi:hypothetical protein